MKYVAVVFGLSNENRSWNPDGDWSAFVADSEGEAIDRATRAQHRWARVGRPRAYRVVVGTLTHEVVRPLDYKLEKL
jgi:hypothetical protein